jgi:hypothetical protein
LSMTIATPPSTRVEPSACRSTDSR